MSRAKTIGTVISNNLHPKDSAIFWTGSGICLNRVLNITKKGGLNGNMSNCLDNKRQNWVDHLPQQNQLTSMEQCNEKRMKKIERKLPKNIKLLKQVELQRAIAEIITNPNKNLEEPKKRKGHGIEILLPKQLNTKSKTIRPNILSFYSFVEPYCNPQ
jgi:hypothetical protein